MSKESGFALPSPKRRELLESATKAYASHVDAVLPYLHSRGIDVETARDWRLGYVLEPAPGHERMAGSLSIPYITPSGVVGMKFRCLEPHDCKSVPHHAKYDSEAGVESYLFGVTNLQTESPFVCICEGELDTVAATALASLPAVGVSGATKWKDHWQYVFEGFEEVVVFLDGDEPKVAGNGKVQPPASDVFERRILGALSNARSVRLPVGEDVNSFLIGHEPKELWEKAGLKWAP